MLTNTTTRTENILQLEAIDNVTKFLFNVNPWDVFKSVYGTNHTQGYGEEKVKLIQRGVSALWPQLDKGHRQRLLDAANHRYRDEKLDPPVNLGQGVTG